MTHHYTLELAKILVHWLAGFWHIVNFGSSGRGRQVHRFEFIERGRAGHRFIEFASSALRAVRALAAYRGGTGRERLCQQYDWMDAWRS